MVVAKNILLKARSTAKFNGSVEREFVSHSREEPYMERLHMGNRTEL